MKTDIYRSLLQYWTASPFYKIGTPLLIISLIFENWERYGRQDAEHTFSGEVLLWTLIVVVVATVIDGTIRFLKKEPMAELRNASRSRKYDKIQLNVFASWIVLSTISRLFLPEGIDRVVSLYIGPIVAILLIIILCKSFFGKKNLFKNLVCLALCLICNLPAQANLVITKNNPANPDSVGKEDEGMQGFVVGLTLIVTSNREKIYEITINGDRFTFLNQNRAEIDIATYPPGSVVTVTTNKNFYIGYLD